MTPTGFAGRSFHTSRYMDGPMCPPIILFMFICTIPFFFLLAVNVSFIVLHWYDKRRQQLVSETFVIYSAIQLQLREPH